VAVTAVIVYSGSRLIRYGDLIAERTGLSRTWVGVAMVASVTSLPELLTGFGSVVVYRIPDIAMGDVLGSCMFNLLILSGVDAMGGRVPVWTKVHRGHALSVGFSILLLGLASLGLFAGGLVPQLGWFSILSPLILLIYFWAIRSIFHYERDRTTGDLSRIARARAPADHSSAFIYSRFALNAVLVIVAATALPSIGERLAVETGLGQTIIGNSVIAFSTSLPEVVTSISAVRLGAIDLAFGGLLGSNIFNIAILAVDDLLYVPGSLFVAVQPTHIIPALGAILMSAIVIVAVTYQTIARKRVMAWDSWAMVAVYITTMTLLFMGS
jgi:cation:H+ antiporter